MPAGPMLQRLVRTHRAARYLGVAGVGLLVVIVLNANLRTRLPVPTVPGAAHRQNRPASQPLAQPERELGWQMHALDFAQLAPAHSTAQPRRNMFQFVNRPIVDGGMLHNEAVQSASVDVNNSAPQIVVAPFKYTGRIGQVAVLVSEDRHWLAREGDRLGSPPAWQVLQVRTDEVLIQDVTTGQVQVLPLPPKK